MPKAKPGPKRKPPETVELRCNLCKYQSRFNGQLLEHFDKKHKDFKGFKCELCDDFDSADVHKKNPIGDQDNKAVNKVISFIRYVMSHRMALDRHKREAHVVTKEYPCELCDHVSGKKEEMKKHQEMCHSDNWWPKSTSKESSEESDEEIEHSEDVIPSTALVDVSDNPVLDDENEMQVDDVAIINDEGVDNEDDFEDNVTGENAGEGLLKERHMTICRDSSDVKEICEKTNAPDDISQDSTDLSKHFIIKQGKVNSPGRIQCAHCTMLFAIKKGDYSGFIYHMVKSHNISFKDPNSPSSNIQVKSAEPSNKSASESPRKETSEKVSRDTTGNSENSGNVSKTVEADMDADPDEAFESHEDQSSMQESDLDYKKSDEDSDAERTVIDGGDFPRVIDNNFNEEGITIEIFITHHDTTTNSENTGNLRNIVDVVSNETCKTLQDCKKNGHDSDIEVSIIEGNDISRDDVNEEDVIEISDGDSESGTESDTETETDIDLERIAAAAERQRIKMRLEKAQSVSEAIASTFAPAPPAQSTEPTTPPKPNFRPISHSVQTASSTSKPLLEKPPSDDFVRKHTQRTGTSTYECNYCTVQFDSRGAKSGLRYHLSKFHNFISDHNYSLSLSEFINPERLQDYGVLNLNPVAERNDMDDTQLPAEEKEWGEDTTKIEASNLKLSSVAPTSTLAAGPWPQRKCMLCHKIVPNQKDLEYHILEHYMPQLMSQLPNIPSASGPFICAECGHHFPNVSKLLWHYGFFHKYIMKFIKEYELQAGRGRRWTN